MHIIIVPRRCLTTYFVDDWRNINMFCCLDQNHSHRLALLSTSWLLWLGLCDQVPRQWFMLHPLLLKSPTKHIGFTQSILWDCAFHDDDREIGLNEVCRQHNSDTTRETTSPTPSPARKVLDRYCSVWRWGQDEYIVIFRVYHIQQGGCVPLLENCFTTEEQELRTGLHNGIRLLQIICWRTYVVSLYGHFASHFHWTDMTH